MVRRYSLWIALAASLAASPLAAQTADPALAARAAKRFPQPVRVGDLIDRDVLLPKEYQTVLGRVAAVARRDGALVLIVRFGGVLGFGARPIAVPMDAVALLGEHVAILDFTPDQLRTFPTAETASLAPLPANDTIRVGLARPFH